MAIDKLEKNQMISLVCEVTARWTAIMVDRNLIPLICVTSRNVGENEKAEFAIEVLAGRGIDERMVELVIERLMAIKKKGGIETVNLK